MKAPNTIAAALMLLLASASAAQAQTKAEQKLYSKALQQNTLTVYDRFLKKYPQSVLAPEIRAKRDTLLNICPFSEEYARTVFSTQFPSAEEFIAFGDRRYGVDRIYGVVLAADDLAPGYVRIGEISQGSKGWTHDSYEMPSSTLDKGFTISLADSLTTFRIGGDKYYAFCYLATRPGTDSLDYVAAAYAPEPDRYIELDFEGTKKTSADGEWLIEGRTEPRLGDQELSALSSILERNHRLVKISDADHITDETIAWWVSNNPNALSLAKAINMNIIPDGSSLESAFAKASGRQESARYSAALLDIRGWTVIVARSKSDGKYMLAWAEPECKDHDRDRLLNNILFDDANTLSMYYYHGRKTFKYRLNLTSKTIER